METSVFPRAKAAAILARLISDDQLLVYGPVLAAAKKAGLRVAVGGGLAFSAYAGYGRNTKDMDLFVVDPDQEKLMAIMAEQGFAEYTDVPYDRTWSYRGSRAGTRRSALADAQRPRRGRRRGLAGWNLKSGCPFPARSAGGAALVQAVYPASRSLRLARHPQYRLRTRPCHGLGARVCQA